MREVLHLSESECARAHSLLPQFVDGDLTVEQSEWLDGHLEACAECRAVLAGFVEIDSELTGWGQRLGWQNPPRPDPREQLAVRLGSLSARHRAIPWMPTATAIAAAVALAVALTVIAPHRKPPVVNRDQAPFVEIPYLPPLDPHENSAIVRMDIRVAALIAMGFRVTTDPDVIVPADVLVGEDGRAHAVRVLADFD